MGHMEKGVSGVGLEIAAVNGGVSDRVVGVVRPNRSTYGTNSACWRLKVE